MRLAFGKCHGMDFLSPMIFILFISQSISSPLQFFHAYAQTGYVLSVLFEQNKKEKIELPIKQIFCYHKRIDSCGSNIIMNVVTMDGQDEIIE
jgi:hypothetical protein